MRTVYPINHIRGHESRNMQVALRWNVSKPVPENWEKLSCTRKMNRICNKIISAVRCKQVQSRITSMKVVLKTFRRAFFRYRPNRMVKELVCFYQHTTVLSALLKIAEQIYKSCICSKYLVSLLLHWIRFCFLITSLIPLDLLHVTILPNWYGTSTHPYVKFTLAGKYWDCILIKQLQTMNETRCRWYEDMLRWFLLRLALIKLRSVYTV